MHSQRLSNAIEVVASLDYLSRTDLLLCRQACRDLKKSIDLSSIWKRFIEKEYPHIHLQQNFCSLYLLLKQVSYNCLKFHVKLTHKSKFDLGFTLQPIMNDEITLRRACTPSFFVVACPFKVQVYATNAENRSFQITTKQLITFPEIYQDRFLLLDQSGVKFEVWDLVTREKIVEMNATQALYGLALEEDYLYYTERNILFFIPLKKGVAKFPLPIRGMGIIENAFTSGSKRYLFDDKNCVITTLEGSVLKRIPHELCFQHSKCSRMGVFETEKFVLISKPNTSYFSVVFSDSKTIYKIPKSHLSPFVTYQHQLFFVNENKLLSFNPYVLTPEMISSNKWEVFHDFGKLPLQFEFSFGNKIIFRNENANGDNYFIIFDISTKQKTKIPFTVSLKYTIDVQQGLVLFIGLNLKNNVENNELILVDASSGKELDRKRYNGQFAGYNSHRNQFVFIDKGYLSNMIFTTHHLTIPEADKVENIVTSFELME